MKETLKNIIIELSKKAHYRTNKSDFDKLHKILSIIEFECQFNGKWLSNKVIKSINQNSFKYKSFKISEKQLNIIIDAVDDDMIRILKEQSAI